MRPNRASGFSLIELMVVVGIIGLLAAIALPSYTDYVRKTRRSAAGACVAAMTQQVERFYTTNLTYTGAAIDTGACEPDALDFYDVALNVVDAKNYTVTASPTGEQSGDACGNLSINQAGTKSQSGTGSSCW